VHGGSRLRTPPRGCGLPEGILPSVYGAVGDLEGERGAGGLPGQGADRVKGFGRDDGLVVEPVSPAGLILLNGGQFLPEGGLADMRWWQDRCRYRLAAASVAVDGHAGGPHRSVLPGCGGVVLFMA